MSVITPENCNKVLQLVKDNFPEGEGFGIQIVKLMKFTHVRNDNGTQVVTLSVPTQPWMQNNYGIVHGGCTATLLDYITTYAFIAHEKYWKDFEEDDYALVVGQAIQEFGLSRHISTQYLSAIPIGIELFCEVRLESSTSRFTHTSCRFHDASGKIYATGTHDKVKQVSKRLSKL
ncbi:hypothetical protein AWJ20_1524 [Sugiyamaella lignohabitans]|uniref:Thioesterase domain-containing protein n=1 Tax=Sugiyamaella lignohabitans TaxID=796027 RepID=A0A167DSI7_9ASCO|nr:uncharacterized protein AWJ20_1524 [Sugiyamaella lignohabitans]ANB13242.1 hypothetical protein AWJ20_1524 [Sugiyamaella lignohabitans]